MHASKILLHVTEYMQYLHWNVLWYIQTWIYARIYVYFKSARAQGKAYDMMYEYKSSYYERMMIM